MPLFQLMGTSSCYEDQFASVLSHKHLSAGKRAPPCGVFDAVERVHAALRFTAVIISCIIGMVFMLTFCLKFACTCIKDSVT